MRLFGIILSLVLMFPSVARADVFIWEDSETGLTFSFPDTWRVLNNQASDDVYTIQAPSASDQAVCRIKVNPDSRYLIYPVRYFSSVQKDAYSTGFWMDYLNGNYRDVVLHRVRDEAGLGRGHASYMLSSYTTLDNDPQFRTSLGFATLYNDKAYVLECSSLAGAFENWRGMFQSIAGSVDFRKAHHELATGYHDDFIHEGFISEK